MGVLAHVLVTAIVTSCRRPATSLHDTDSKILVPGTSLSQPSSWPPSSSSATAASAPSAAPAFTVDYPVDTRPPKDFFNDDLLRTLTREASLVIVCSLQGLHDILEDSSYPDIFYAATCDVSEVLKGSLPLGPVRFIWQVERGSRMPPPGSELLVYLKARHERMKEDPLLKWLAIDTGVMSYTNALRVKLHQYQKKK